MKEDIYVSGQAIAGRLGLTRAAVWKSVENLRKIGFSIESVPSRGYRLVSLPDLLVPPVVLAELKTERFGRTIVYEKEVPSTNDVAMSRASVLPHGALVLAEVQSRGKGRLSRRWDSPSGGIYASLLLKPPLTIGESACITLVMGEAIASALEDVAGEQARIKWPNDIFMDGKKVCGILTRIDGNMDCVNWIVIGIGINVNIPRDHFEKRGLTEAGSLKSSTGREISRRKVLCRALECMESNYSRFLEGDLAGILDGVRQRDALFGREITLTGLRTEMNGVGHGIDDAGRLLFLKPDGSLEHILSGDVSIRKLFQ